MKRYYGETNGQSKLTNEQVIEIVELFKNEILTDVAIGKIYGVHQNTIHSIRSGKNWNNLTGIVYNPKKREPVKEKPIKQVPIYVDLPDEEWCDIEGSDGLYQISTHDRVKSFRKFATGQILKNHISSNGYPVCQFRLPDKKRVPHTIHRLKAIAFIPNPDNKPQIHHKDGNPLNTDLSNFVWCDGSYNVKQNSVLHPESSNYGCLAEGEKNPSAKLTAEQAKEVFALAEKGELIQKEIAQKYGISQGSVSDIHLCRKWQSTICQVRKKEKRKRAKLTPELIKEIYKNAHESNLPNVKIGEILGVSWITVHKIKHGIIHSSITGHVKGKHSAQLEDLRNEIDDPTNLEFWL